MHLVWNPEGKQAASNIKVVFIITPIVMHRNQLQPFTVEADTSKTGIEGVLSEHFPKSCPLIPFFQLLSVPLV